MPGPCENKELNMSINYYPDSVVKMRTHVVDKLQRPNVLYGFRGMADVAKDPLITGLWCPQSWEIVRVCLHFNNAIAKTFMGAIAMGTGVVTGKNDTLWFRPSTDVPQSIVLSQGIYYTGALLSSQLKTKLDSNAAFIAQGAAPFTVGYAAATGIFSIASNGGKLFSYENVNPAVPVRSNSTGGHLFGLTANQGPAAVVTSNTSMMGLGESIAYITGAGSTDTNIVATDVVAMTVDNAFVIYVNQVAATVAYEVVYRTLDI